MCYDIPGYSAVERNTSYSPSLGTTTTLPVITSASWIYQAAAIHLLIPTKGPQAPTNRTTRTHSRPTNLWRNSKTSRAFLHQELTYLGRLYWSPLLYLLVVCNPDIGCVTLSSQTAPSEPKQGNNAKKKQRQERKKQVDKKIETKLETMKESRMQTPKRSPQDSRNKQPQNNRDRQNRMEEQTRPEKQKQPPSIAQPKASEEEDAAGRDGLYRHASPLESLVDQHRPKQPTPAYGETACCN